MPVHGPTALQAKLKLESRSVLTCGSLGHWRAIHLSLLGAEGKALGRDFIVRLIKSGVKPTISGDLWSDGGMGLFGIYAHGISESWVSNGEGAHRTYIGLDYGRLLRAPERSRMNTVHIVNSTNRTNTRLY